MYVFCLSNAILWYCIWSGSHIILLEHLARINQVPNDSRLYEMTIIDVHKAFETTRYQTWQSPVEYPSHEHDIKECYGDMFNSIFSKKVQGQKHPGR